MATAHESAQPPSQLDLESQHHQTPNRSGSRASLPLSAQQSSSQGQSDHADAHRDGRTEGDGGGEALQSNGGVVGEDDYAWGPAHPCYPHLNTHVPPNSPLYATTRIIRVRRDWMTYGDLAPTFANLYPEVLDPHVSEDAFRKLLRHINDELAKAFLPWTWRNVLDSVLGLATGWLWEDAGLARVKGQLKELELWLERWNRDVGSREGVTIIPLRRTAYMSLDFQIPDPQIDTDVSAAAQLPATPPDVAKGAGLDTLRHGDSGPPQPIRDLSSLRAGGMKSLSAGRA